MGPTIPQIRGPDPHFQGAVVTNRGLSLDDKPGVLADRLLVG
jgi:hypothetical protein